MIILIQALNIDLQKMKQISNKFQEWEQMILLPFFGAPFWLVMGAILHFKVLKRFLKTISGLFQNFTFFPKVASSKIDKKFILTLCNITT